MTFTVVSAPAGFDAEIPIVGLHTEDPTALVKAALRRGFTPIWLSELADAIAGRRGLPAQPMVLTFDDGDPLWYSVTHAVLTAYDFKANLCITSDYLDQVDLAAFSNTGITWDQAREMHAAGIYEWQNHSKTHTAFTGLSEGTLQAELAACAAKIVSELGASAPRAVIYPNGAFNASVLTIVEDAGYEIGLRFGESDRFSRIPGSVPLALNRAGGLAVGSLLQWAAQREIHDFGHDLTNGRNAANVLGFWTLPAGTSLAENGRSVQVDSTGTGSALAAITTDYFRVDSGRLYSYLSASSASQTAGTAKVTIKQYDEDLVALADIDLASMAAVQAATAVEGTVNLHADCQFVRLQVSGDAAYDGIAKADRWHVHVV